MKYQKIGGMTQQYYHSIPDPLDLITTTPTKQAISKFLSQLTYKQFPEFVLDILVKVYNHQKIDITDGQGDEQQDILTINPKGQRCLTQCKHTKDVGSHYNGTDLDNMVTICLRKSCKQAFFVTNGDLTPQAKKYVTDGEYNRLLTVMTTETLDIDYWNDIRIWDRIKGNSDILNKWFSGMGQTSGMRNFKFSIFLQVLPTGTNTEGPVYSLDIIKTLTDSGKLTDNGNDFFLAELPSGLKVSLNRNFLSSAELDIRYVLPNGQSDFTNSIIDSIQIEVTVPEIKYDPKLLRTEVLSFLFNDTLPGLEEGQWWHITSSACKSFIYLYDIGEPKEIKLCSAKTYIKVKDSDFIGEFEYCSLNSPDFRPTFENEDSDQSIWMHGSGLSAYQMFDQQLSPEAIYNHQLMELKHMERYSTYNFYAATDLSVSLSMRIRKILPNEWFALLQNDDTILWGIPPDTEVDEIELAHRKLKVLGLQILEVEEETRNEILANISKDMPPPTFMYIADMESLSYPVNLEKRIVTIIADVPVPKMTIEIGINLLNYKYTIEDIRGGFPHLKNGEPMKSHTSEIPSLLADIMSIRGSIMLDIGVQTKPLKIFLRFNEGAILPSHELALKYIEEAGAIIHDIEQILAGKELENLGYLSKLRIG